MKKLSNVNILGELTVDQSSFLIGSVGIGTTNMYARLNVRATSHTNGISVNRAADNTAALYIGNDGAGTPILAANNADMLFGRDFSGTFTERMRLTNAGRLGIGTTSPEAPLHVAPSSDFKVLKIGGDLITHYKITGTVSHTLTLTCGSYYQAEVIITANQTNGGGYNNYYLRGIWSNNHTSHKWDILEEVGYLTGSSFIITNGQNDVSNSGKLEIVHNYIGGSFAGMTVRVTDMYNNHSYTII